MAELRVPVDETDHAQGSTNAPVTMIEYGDFQCPHCAAAHGIIKAVQRIAGDELRFVYRHFPLTQIHPLAELAAETSEVLGTQGKFWEAHDLIFENQEKLSPEFLMELARRLSTNIKKFMENLDAHVSLPKVRKDFMSGLRSGVNGTPSIFINGKRLMAPVTLPVLLSVIGDAGRVTRYR